MRLSSAVGAAAAFAWAAVSALWMPREAADALVYSSILALAAVGITLAYQTVKVPNFAHGALVNVGVVTTMWMSQAYAVPPYYALAPSMALSAAAAAALYLYLLPLYRRRAGGEILMMATMAYNIAFIGLLNAFADGVQRAGVFMRGVTLLPYDPQPMGIPAIYVAAPLTAVAAALGLHLFLRTKLGTALRAAVENEDLARSLGIDVERAYAVAWLIIGAAAGAAGTLLPLYMQGSPEVGWLILASFFAASIVGGLSNIYGALAGALLMGFVEVLGTRQLAELLSRLAGISPGAVTAYRPLVPLLAIAATLILAPRGILARR